jgi:hypothetical protein
MRNTPTHTPKKSVLSLQDRFFEQPERAAIFLPAIALAKLSMVPNLVT